MKIKLFLFALTVCISHLSFAQIKMEDLKIDLSVTGFQYATDFQGTRVFTKNGKSDISTINPSAFSFTIATGLTAQAAKDQLEMLVEMSKQNGYTFTDLKRVDTMLNGNKAYYISYTETTQPNYKNIVFNAFVIKDNTLVLFTSGDLDKGIYIDKFKQTFYSIKL